MDQIKKDKNYYIKKYEETIDEQKYSFKNYLLMLLDSNIHFTDWIGRDIPEKPGVYKIINYKTKEVLYIGEAKDLRRRLNNHRIGPTRTSMFRIHIRNKLSLNEENEISEYINNNYSFQYVVNSLDRKQFEQLLINIFEPSWNNRD